MMRKAIVTGGAGFIGMHLCFLLEENGWDVTIIDDFSTHDNDSLVDKSKLIRKRVQDVDIEDLPPLNKVDAVFHLAGKVGPVGVIKFKGGIAKDTVDSSYAAAFWASVAGCPMIDISTSEVYGSPDDANTEDTPKVFRNVSPRMEYAVSKLAAEAQLQVRDNLDVRIIRPFNVAGWGQQPSGGFVLPRFAIQALSNLPLTVYTPGTQVRAFTSVTDIVRGIYAVYEQGRAGETYNLGNPGNKCSILDLAHEVRDVAGSSSDIVIIDPAELWGPDFVEAPDKIPNADKALRELGWQPEIGRAQIINEVVTYWSMNVNTSDWAASFK